MRLWILFWNISNGFLELIGEDKEISYLGRKGVPTQNVIAACDFDLLLTFVMVGWEGAAHGTRIFLDAICTDSVNFPKPPPGI